MVTIKRKSYGKVIQIRGAEQLVVDTEKLNVRIMTYRADNEGNYVLSIAITGELSNPPIFELTTPAPQLANIIARVRPGAKNA